MVQGQAVLVTGGGTGIGAAITTAFAAAGADVAVADIDRDSADRQADTLRGHGVRSLSIIADCGDVATVTSMVEEAAASFGRLDILVNNAATTFPVDLLDLDEAGWDRVYRVNIKGAFFALQRAARMMIAAGGGRIINISSISGRGYPNAANVAYSTSKAALISLTQLAARRLGPHGINVNAICPGMTMTSLLRRTIAGRAANEGVDGERMIAALEHEIPTRRANSPEDIAAMALFLAGPGGRNINGQAYNVDGGVMTN